MSSFGALQAAGKPKPWTSKFFHTKENPEGGQHLPSAGSLELHHCTRQPTRIIWGLDHLRFSKKNKNKANACTQMLIKSKWCSWIKICNLYFWRDKVTVVVSIVLVGEKVGCFAKPIFKGLLTKFLLTVKEHRHLFAECHINFYTHFINSPSNIICKHWPHAVLVDTKPRYLRKEQHCQAAC